MIRRIQIAVILAVITSSVRAQEFNLGGNFGFNIFQKTTLDLAVYQPENSYYTYFESNNGAGLIDKNSFLNGLHFGGSVNFMYKRLGVYLEPQFYYQRSVLEFEQPYITERVLAKKGFRMPLYFTYKFYKKARSAYSIIGLSLVKEKNWDFQNPGVGYYLGDEVLYNNSIDLGDDHFKDVLYNDQAYWNLMIGLGKHLGRMNTSVRYLVPLGREKKGLQGKMWGLELGINFFFLSTKELTQKHHLYVE